MNGRTTLDDLSFVQAAGFHMLINFHTNHILKDLREGGGLSFPPILKLQLDLL